MARPPYDLVLTGGTLLEPSQGIEERRDLALADGRVAAIEPEIPADQGLQVLDVSGLLVTPGLVDMHAHVYVGVCPLVVPIDEIASTSGVTTVVSTGDAGAHTFGGFRKLIVNQVRTRVYAFVHISTIGLTGWEVGEMRELDYADPDKAARVVRENRDICLGVKVRQGRQMVGANGLDPLRRAIEAAEMSASPVMVHIGDAPEPLPEILALLRPGDIVTHCFTGQGKGILAEDGSLLPEVRQARSDGILFDVGHGMGSFDFRVGEAALAQGFPPDFISSDLHSGCVNGPTYDLPTTISKFLLLGMPLAEGIRLATAAPAAIINREPLLGTLQVGAPGDIAVFALADDETTFVDAMGQARTGPRGLVPRHTMTRGRLWGRPYPHPYL